MGKNTNSVSSQVMELKDLISGPLVATIDADTISARRYLQYLFELAFESYDKQTGKVGDMRMLTFEYRGGDASSGGKKQRVSIPIMTLVPLPLLQIKEADFDFDINVIDALSQDSNSTFSLKEGGEDEAQGAEGSKLRVALSPSKSTTSEESSSVKQGLSANMKVKVKMRQADLPGGVANLMNLTTNNLLIEDINEEEADDE